MSDLMENISVQNQYDLLCTYLVCTPYIVTFSRISSLTLRKKRRAEVTHLTISVRFKDYNLYNTIQTNKTEIWTCPPYNENLKRASLKDIHVYFLITLNRFLSVLSSTKTNYFILGNAYLEE